MSNAVYEVLLEKKGRGRSFMGRPWAVRTFKLKEQNLEYYDGDKLKGTISIAGSKTGKIPPEEADGKTFPFAVATKEEKLILNASSIDKSWTLQPKSPPPAPPVEVDEVQQKIEKTQEEFDTAATAAVAAVFAENAEKARLEEEQKQLEEQRLRQATEAAAKLMEDELANKKLREAKEAEKKQQEEQERQVMNLLKGLGAKAKFKTALQHGKLSVAREAAATMVQGAYRAKIAHRNMLIKKAEKDRLRREAYAKKIQCRYRTRLARRKMEKIKAEKLAIKRKLMAMRIQSSWRIFIARKKYRLKQEAKLEAEFQRSVAKQRSVILMQTFIRAFLAKRRVTRINVTYPSVAYVSVVRVEGLSSGSIDPVAIVSGVTLNLPNNHQARTNSKKKVPEEVIKTTAKASSHYKVESIQAKHHALATALTYLDFITVTLVEKGSKDDFLGQALIRTAELAEEAAKSATRTVEVTVPLNSQLLVPILDENKAPLATVRKASTGSITLAITLPDPNYSMCGWLWKVSESLLSNAWKKRWFVLVDDQLQYFNSELQLEASKNIVVCNSITSVKEEAHKGRQATKISYTVNGVESFWMLDWDESANASIKRMWLRKLYRSSPALSDPTMEAIKAKLTGLKVSVGTHDKAISPQGKTKVPVSRRMSVFK
eukprot:gene12894-14129_t